jgi:transcriptional regulator with XRE-family HTH domain
MSSLHSARYRELVRRLRAARERAGLTQTEVAETLKKPQSFVSKVELCERRLDPIELLDLAALYRVLIADLLANLSGDKDGKKDESSRKAFGTDRHGRAGKG